MFVDSMDCFLTYNLSCIIINNNTFTHLNSSSTFVGVDYDSSGLAGSENINIESTTSSILVSIQHCILTTLILGSIILSTITGNIFVIAAVFLEKSLHSVAYYLIVSLAAADLMVAAMVMPVALLKEVTRSWVLGAFICEAWVMIDLLCCTASILHLVAIALDRYWAITNLDYGTKRTPTRIIVSICIIWITSILISSSHLFPVFRNKNGRPSDQCHLIGTVPYTILSTIGAFYIPMFVMCIIYWKIFQAAKFRIRRKAFNTNRSPPPPPPATPMLVLHQQDDVPSPNPKIKQPSFSPSRFKRLKKTDINHHEQQCDIEIEPELPSTHSSSASHQNHQQQQEENDYQLKPLKKSSYYLLSKKRGGTMMTTTTTTTPTTPVLQLSTTNRLRFEHDDEIRQPLASKLIVTSPASASSTRRLITSSFITDSPVTSTLPMNTIQNPLMMTTDNSSPSGSPRLVGTSLKPLSSTELNQNNNNILLKKSPSTLSSSSKPNVNARKKIDIKRERKAAKVLGVVMGCFMICWLPFFIEEMISGVFHLTINEKIISVLTWLGYLNSLLNPVIYTIFSPDFRQAFGNILFGKYRKRRQRLKK